MKSCSYANRKKKYSNDLCIRCIIFQNSSVQKFEICIKLGNYIILFLSHASPYLKEDDKSKLDQTKVFYTIAEKYPQECVFVHDFFFV